MVNHLELCRDKRTRSTVYDYNAFVQEGKVPIFLCAYLHNYRRHDQDPLDAEQYETYLEDAPAFTRGEVTELRDFINNSIRTGDNKDLLMDAFSINMIVKDLLAGIK